MDLLGFFKERNDFLEIKICFPLKNPRPHRILRFRIGCGPAPCGSRAAGRPSAPARDPAMGGAAGFCVGRCVAWEKSGGPHRIRADRLRSLPRVVPRVQSGPLLFRRWPKVFDRMFLRVTAVGHGLAGGEVSAGASSLHTIASQGFPGVAGSKEHAQRGRRPSRRGRRRRRRGDGGVAVVLAPYPSAGMSGRVCYGVREAARAQGKHQ
jgi:hypothetical protein